MLARSRIRSSGSRICAASLCGRETDAFRDVGAIQDLLLQILYLRS